MRPQKVKDEELIENIFQSIRSKGYDGVSIRDLEKVSGLKKASLYHRFPEGKKEMTEKVLEYVGKWLNENIFSILTAHDIDCESRLKKVLKGINKFYNNGEYTCLFKALSLDNSYNIFDEQLQKGMSYWVDSWSQFGEDKGFSKEVANQKAIKVVIIIQGALTVSKVMKDNSVFTSSLEDISSLYTT